MASPWRTVRVFISSTFRDMHAERDFLVKVVFPALRERLEKYRVYLVDIDLRWGITEEQSDNDEVLYLCLNQIDECRPFFLGLLGERYGWVPSKLPDGDSKLGWTQQYTGKSVTELEILWGVLLNTGMRDHGIFFFRDPSFINDVPAAKRVELQAESPESAHKLAELKDRIRHAGLPVPIAENYSCRYAGLRINWRLARFDLHETDQKALEIVAADGLVDNAEYAELDARLKEIVHRYSTVYLTGLEDFGRQVFARLWTSIQTELKLDERPAEEAAADPVEEEFGYHERFMESRLRVYVGREALQTELTNFADGNDGKPALVTGPSGSGKSAALAKFATTYAERHPEVLLIPHFIGASPASTSLRQTLQRFCLILKREYGFIEDVPQETNELTTRFRDFVGRVPVDRRIVCVVDALNQLDETDNAQSLYWLPWQLPPHVKVITSCITDPNKEEPALKAFEGQMHYRLEVESLTDRERRAIIREVPSLAAKTLDERQTSLLVLNPATKNPLFLLVALEELRGFGSFEQLNRRIQQLPREGDTVTALFSQVIERLKEEFHPRTVAAVLTLMAGARRGLSDRELLDLVEGQSVGVDQSRSDLFPILRQLRPYLQYRGELRDFSHRNLDKAVRAEFLPDDASRVETHAQLAAYFLQKADPHADRSWKDAAARALEELPFHLLQSRRWAELERLVRDRFFDIQAEVIGVPAALYDTRAVAEALGTLGDEHWSQFIDYARAFSELSERLHGNYDTLQEFLSRGEVNRVASMVQFQLDDRRRQLLMLVAATLMHERGNSRAAASMRADAAASLRDVKLEFPLRCLIHALVSSEEIPIPKTVVLGEVARPVRLPAAVHEAKSQRFPAAMPRRMVPNTDAMLALMGSIFGLRLWTGCFVILLSASFYLYASDKKRYVSISPTERFLEILAFLTVAVIVGCVGIVALRRSRNLLLRRRHRFGAIFLGLRAAAKRTSGQAHRKIIERAIRFESLLQSMQVNHPYQDLLCRMLLQELKQCQNPSECARWIDLAAGVDTKSKRAIAEYLGRLEKSHREAVLVQLLARANAHRWEVFQIFISTLDYDHNPDPRLVAQFLAKCPERGGGPFLHGVSSALKAARPECLARSVLAHLTAKITQVPWRDRMRSALGGTFQFPTPMAPVEVIIWPISTAPLIIVVVLFGLPIVVFGYAVLAAFLAGMRTHDSLGFRFVDVTLEMNSVRRAILARLNSQSIDLLLLDDSRHVRRTVAAQSVLTGEDCSIHATLLVAGVIKDLVRGGLFGTRSDLVLKVMGDRQLLQLALAHTTTGKEMFKKRSLSVRDHQRQLQRVLPPRFHLAHVIAAISLAVCSSATLCAAAASFAPPDVAASLRGDQTFNVVILCGILGFSPHIGRSERGMAARGCLWILVWFGVSLWFGSRIGDSNEKAPAVDWYVGLYFAAVITASFGVPELISRIRGSHLLYPSPLRLACHRCIWSVVAVSVLAFGAAWLVAIRAN